MTMLNAIASFFAYTIVAIGAQNVIFTRGLGLSNGLRMINDPKKDTLYFCASFSLFQLINSVLAYFVLPLITRYKFEQYARFVSPVIIVMCCAFSFIVVVFILSIIVSKQVFKKIVLSLTSASINSAIVGTIILTTSRGFNLIETIGFAVGSSIGYFLAMILISEGNRKIRHDLVPEHFKGLPIMLIYISVLALAIYGLTGNAVAL